MTMPAELVNAVPPEPDPVCSYCSTEIPADRMLTETSSDQPICTECAVTCEDCGAIVHADDATCLENEQANSYRQHTSAAVCSDCIRMCDHCHQPCSRENVVMRVTSNGNSICPTCYDGNYFTCPECDDVEHYDFGYTSCYDDETRCSSCHDRHNDQHDSDNEYIGQYHSSRGIVTPIPSPASTAANGLYFGVELEVERANNANDSADAIAGMIASHVAQARSAITDGRNVSAPVLCFEEDGSLSDGFEMVSAPMGLDDQRRLWSHVLTAPVMRQLRSHDTSTCGLHIHLTRRALTTIQVAKIVTFVNDPDNERLIRAIARRYDGGFCHIKAKRLAVAHNPEDSRYQAVNLWNTRTIELRIFKGSLKLSAVLAALEFAYALVRFTATCSGSGFNLKSAAFLSFIATDAMRSDTKYLRAYLADRLPSCQEK